MEANIELLPVAAEQPADAQSQGLRSGSASLSGEAADSRLACGTDHGSQEQADTSPVQEGQHYIESFRLSRHLIPHWRNVLSPSRVNASGSILLLWFGPGTGILDRQELSSETLHPESLVERFTPDPSGVASPPQAVFVRDISSRIMNTLGPTFNLSPESFEEHLVQSGYTASSYLDPEPSTWPTRFLCKHQASLRWFSVVPRKDMEPRDEFSRCQLLADGLKWSRESRQRGEAGEVVFIRRSHELHTSTNIFRREWPLSLKYRPSSRKLHSTSETSWNESFGVSGEVLVEIGDDNASIDSSGTGDDSALEETNIVAWEERITFCWGNHSHERRRRLNPRYRPPKPRDCTQPRPLHSLSRNCGPDSTDSWPD